MNQEILKKNLNKEDFFEALFFYNKEEESRGNYQTTPAVKPTANALSNG